NVSGNNTYAEEGSYAIRVLVQDVGGNSVTLHNTALVAESSDLTATATQFTAVVGTSFSGQVATFNDGGNTDSISNFTATIHWGDGAPDAAGDISQPGGSGSAYVV